MYDQTMVYATLSFLIHTPVTTNQSELETRSPENFRSAALAINTKWVVAKFPLTFRLLLGRASSLFG
jgi:hypothetical protein